MGKWLRKKPANLAWGLQFCGKENRMNIGFYQSVSGMTSNWEAQNAISSNLARREVPGGRAEFEVFLADASTGADAAKGASGPPIKTKAYYDFSPGNLRKSDSPYHFAITGNAFFRVREPNGIESFTRNGQFVKGVDGYVRTTDGANVLDSEGQFLELPESGVITAREDGTILVDGQERAQLGFAQFGNPSDALRLGAYGRFTLADPSSMVVGLGERDRVYQNYLEESNVKPVEEMIKMIEIHRAYEANQKMVKTNDEATGQLIKIMDR